MAYIGSAFLNVTPKFPNLKEQVAKALGDVDATPAGTRMGSQIGRGIASQGAVFAAFSELTSRALDAIGSHVDAAVSRFDTLNQYPRTMQMLGYSAEDAEASIGKMSERLQTLPTRLDDMASFVQGIVVTTRDLDLATDAGLALNDMLVASGSSTQLVNAAMEQFRQMLAKGKPELEDWKSLTSAMPGQMDQLAKAMLGPTAGANDLYAALGGGKGEAVLSMDDLLRAMVRLDEQGGAGIASFREQAETAAGGVATAMENASNAVTRGISGIMDEIGQDRISGVLGDAREAIDAVFGTASDVVAGILPALDGVYDRFSDIAPQAATLAVSFAGFKAAGGYVSDLASRAREASRATSMLEGANALLGTSFTPVSLGITAAAAAAGLAATAYLDARHDAEMLEEATTGLSQAVADTSALDDYSGSLSAVAQQSSFAAMGVDELAESTARRVETMRANNEEAEAEIANLSNAQAVINAYAGESDLSAEAQGRLEWALRLVNEQFGLSITQADVAAGSYRDANGEVVDLRDSINELIESKKEEARVSAITANLSEAYSAQADAAKTLAQAQRDYNDRVQWHLDANPDITRARAEELAATSNEARALESATEQYDSATESVRALEGELGSASEAASDAADGFDAWGSAAGPLFEQQLAAAGTSLSMLKDDLRQLGASTDDLSALSADDLAELARTYDGTAASAARALDSLGVAMDRTAADAALAAADIASALERMGASDALERAGIDVDLFCSKLAEAGASVDDLDARSISRLAESFGGDIDSMVWAIQNYNNVPLLNKDGTVSVDDASLIDAQGNVYTWNGSELVDQNGTAAADDTSLTDAQGNVYTWNGSELKALRGSATVTGNLDAAISSIQQWNSLTLGDKWASMTVQQRYTTLHVPRNAAGGIRLHAEGGVREHAAGAIATGPVFLDEITRDLVGEDGAEAIVPLTNRRYSQPFVDLIAEGVAERGAGGEATELLRAAVDLLAAILKAMPGGVSARDWNRAVWRANA